MSASDAFLQAILDAPDDDLPRLIYADWLDEHGEAARAEFIRVQIERTRLPANDERQSGLAAREKNLLHRHGLEWMLPHHFRIQEFHRGFVQRIATTDEQFLRVADDVFRSAPVNDLHLTAVGNLPDGLAGCAYLSRLRFLTVDGYWMPPSRLSEIIHSEHLHSLRTLRLPQAWFGETAAMIIAASDNLGSLKELEVVGQRLSDGGAISLANAAHLSSLESLRLRGEGELDTPAARIRAAGAGAIARSRYLTRLTTLDLAHNFVGDAGLAALADSANLSHLTTLDLTDNDIGSSGDVAVQRLCESPYLTHLTTLDLRMNVIGRSSHRRLRARFGDAVLL